MRPIIFNKAGDIVLVKYNAAGTLDLTDPSKFVAANGVIESIKPSIETTTSDLPNGNSDWPLGPFDTGRKGSIEVNMSSFQPNLYAALMGVDKASESTQNFWKVNEGGTIPSAAAYTVTLNNAVVVGGVITVVDNTGSPFASVASGPASGQFTVATDTLTFNSVDAGKEIFATYQYATLTSEKLSLPASGTRLALHAIISGQAMSEDGTATFDFNVTIDKCKATGAIAPPPQQRQPAGWKFDLQVMEPRSGQNVMDYNYKLS